MKLGNESIHLHSIYRATEGEGIHIGTPQVFVRFQGCAIGCVNCDSKDTWDFNANSQLPIENVLFKIASLGGDELKRVSITGGDPLHPKNLPHVQNLARELKELGYWVNLEAAGTRVVDDLFEKIDFISYDLKTPSTGVRTSWDLLEQFIQKYSMKSQVKAVIQDKKDFDYLLECYHYLETKFTSSELLKCNFVITPSYQTKEDFPQERFTNILEYNELAGGKFRVIGQQHKWFFGPDRLDV